LGKDGLEAGRDREKVEDRQNQGVAEVGESLDRFLSDVPDETLSGGEVRRVSHADHRVVDQTEVDDTVDIDSGAQDEGEVYGERGEEDDAKTTGASRK